MHGPPFSGLSHHFASVGPLDSLASCILIIIWVSVLESDTNVPWTLIASAASTRGQGTIPQMLTN